MIVSQSLDKSETFIRHMSEVIALGKDEDEQISDVYDVPNNFWNLLLICRKLVSSKRL